MTVRKRGKTWQAQVRIKENGVLVYSESATRETKAAATLWKLQRQAEIKENGWRQRVTTRTTLADLLEKTETLKARIKPLSRGMAHSFAALQNDPELAALPLPEVTSDKLVAWGVKKHEAGNAPATVMHHLAILLSAFRSAKPALGIDADPKPVSDAIAQLKRLRVAAPSRKVEQRITDADLAKILPEFDDERAIIDMRRFVMCALHLPRRREELCTARKEHLAADGSTLKLVDTKNPRRYREEVVPVPPAALPFLEGGDAERFFPYKPESVSRAWQRATARAGLPHLRLHDLRHEGISRLFEQGLSIEEVALISGHTSWATLKRYTHLRPQQVTEKLRNAGR